MVDGYVAALERDDIGLFKKCGRRLPIVERMLSLPEARSTGMPVIDAHGDFLRARRAALVALAGRRLVGRRPNHPRALADAALLPTGVARLEVISLRSIVGTAEPTSHFDARFRPTSEIVRPRWERVALAHRQGIPLPPIAVLEGPDGHYVVDGRHRVSVALARGWRDIDAWVTRGPDSRHSATSRSAPEPRQRRE